MGERYYNSQLNTSSPFNNFLYPEDSLPDLCNSFAQNYSGLLDEHRLPVRYFNNQNHNMNIKLSNGLVPSKYHGTGPILNHQSGGVANAAGTPATLQSYGSHGEHTRYAPYYTNRASCSYASALNSAHYQQQYGNDQLQGTSSYASSEHSEASTSTKSSGQGRTINASTTITSATDLGNQPVTLQINNLDCTMDENSVRHFLSNQLKPITPIVSMTFEGNLYVKVTVPNAEFAKRVVSNLHRKRIGHKRMVVSYTRDSSSSGINVLRCQVAGLLKDVPYGTLSMCKFRELFQSRFKTSISVLDLSKMQDICSIRALENDEKYISLHAQVLSSIKSSPLLDGLQHSVPYCTKHFQREQHKGWAEQDIEPLPNVFMTVSEVQSIIYPLLKNHTGDIPVASLVHCIKGELRVDIKTNENGVNLEHLICCIQGVQITTNNFGIKILKWLEPENVTGSDANEGRFLKCRAISDPLFQISRETIDLVKMSPKSTMKFNRFIPAYHNHFGKQCRVADYGYTKLIELFEALSSVIQIMGDGENRQITLHHRTQVRRFTSDLLRILRAQANKSILLSQLPAIFSQAQNRIFDVTDYGVCDVVDILDGLVNSNTVVISHTQNGNDILISFPKRTQTPNEMEKTCIFAGEVVDLLRNASQYSILFQKFVRSYHYHFGYQCRLSDYGFIKLMDLMEAIQGVVDIEATNDEDKHIRLSAKVAQRIFGEQLEDLVREFTGCGQTFMPLEDVLQLHKKKYGFQIQSQTLGVENILDAINILPYIELYEIDNVQWIICHSDDTKFRDRCYSACKIIQETGKDRMLIQDFIRAFSSKYNETLSEKNILAMKHAIGVVNDKGLQHVVLTDLMKLITKLIRLLDGRYMMLYEIKEAIMIGTADCTKFGYPNLLTLLTAFWDIFVVEAGPSHDRSEVCLATQGNTINHQSRSNPLKQRKTSINRKSAGDKLLSAIAPIDYSKSNNFTDVPASQNRNQQNSSDDIFPSLSSTFNNSNNKENSYNSILNGSLNSSMLSDLNSSVCSMTNNNNNDSHHIGLWNRRHERYLRENQDMNQFLLRNFPPKPDTPKFEKIPFWLDPVWKNANSSQLSPLELSHPNLKSLISPYTLSKMNNMKSMFSFAGGIKNE